MSAPISMDEMAAAARNAPKTKLSLEQVTALGEQLEQLQARIDRCAEEGRRWKGLFDKIALQELPEAMQQLGLEYFGLSSGDEISIEEFVSCKIKPEHAESAHAWLRERGHGDLIKNEVTVVFGKEEDQDAQRLMEIVSDPGTNIRHSAATREEKVHPQTLKAFVKDRLRAGEEMPSELFGLYVANIARLNKVKKKK